MSQDNHFYLSLTTLIVLLITLYSVVLVGIRVNKVLSKIETAEEEWQAEERKEIAEYDRLLGSLQRFAHVRRATFPAAVVEACANTGRPQLCAAVALRESTGNPYVRHDFDGKRYLGYGLFGVQEKWWGKVSMSPYEQGQQWQRVMTTLLERHGGNVINALADYNQGREFGAAGLHYAADVLKEAQTVR